METRRLQVFLIAAGPKIRVIIHHVHVRAAGRPGARLRAIPIPIPRPTGTCHSFVSSLFNGKASWGTLARHGTARPIVRIDAVASGKKRYPSNDSRQFCSY